MKTFKRILIILLLIVAVVAFLQYPKLNIIAGYASKNMASSHFIGGHDYASITKNENNMPLIKLAGTSYDMDTISASIWGLMEREAVYRDGLGCVLVKEGREAKVLPSPKRSKLENSLPFPYGNNGKIDTVLANIDYQKLAYAVSNAFANDETQKTRTVLVVYKDQIVAERYIDGFSEKTPILGWSMTKSVLATLYGILQYQGKISVNDPAPIPEWQNDTRKKITLNHLLRMQSGLAWDEDYASISDVTEMLFLDANMTKKQASKEALAPPTELWNYSSGTTNLLSGILRSKFDSHQSYLDFPYTALIDKIGMHSMLLEADMEGNFVGSSYGWANTRDWAKFGLLYLHNGNWNGEQLFDSNWSDYVRKPTKKSDKVYGAHFWLNAGEKYPNVPKDLYSANGFQGQRVYIIPSKELVIVRTGLVGEPDFEAGRFLQEVIGAFE